LPQNANRVTIVSLRQACFTKSSIDRNDKRRAAIVTFYFAEVACPCG
jgi:hypothetical protein